MLIADVNAAIKSFSLLNAYGMDEYDFFYAIAWAVECYERGILSKEETDGLELRWGDPLLVLELTRRIANREGNLGKLLAKGVAGASREIGRGSEKYAMQMKGMAADEIKCYVGWGLVETSSIPILTSTAPVSSRSPLLTPKVRSRKLIPMRR